MKIYTTALASLILIAAFAGCSQSSTNYDVLAARNVKCPSGTQLEYTPWGKSGLSAICVARNGPIVIAEDGHVVIEGQYTDGKKTGEWRWFDSDGKVTRTEIEGAQEIKK